MQSALRTFAAAGLSDRTQCVVGDFFDRLPAGHDGYLLSRVLHDWSDDDARQILRCCRRAMSADGRLIVVDALLPARVADGRDAIRMDLHMMVLFGSRERTEEELTRSSPTPASRCGESASPPRRPCWPSWRPRRPERAQLSW